MPIMRGATAWERCRLHILQLVAGFILAGCNAQPYNFSGPDAPRFVPPVATKSVRPKVALVLGSGGRRGFAHVGVIKALEAGGITPDIVVGTSIGSLIGALYAGGYTAAQLEEIAVEMNLSDLIDISFVHWGYIRGQAVQDFVNEKLRQRPIERLSKPFAVVATRRADNTLQIFNAGNTGVAVRAASAVPARFLPVRIDGVEYVDGDVVSPVPACAARRLGAEVVIAVDISAYIEDVPDDVPDDWVVRDVARRKQIDAELAAADVVIHPDLGYYAGTSAEYRARSIAVAAKATQALIPKIRAVTETNLRGSVNSRLAAAPCADVLRFPTAASAAPARSPPAAR